MSFKQFKYCIKADEAIAELKAEWERELDHAYTMGRDDCGHGADAYEESYKLFTNRQLQQSYVDGWHEELMT